MSLFSDPLGAQAEAGEPGADVARLLPEPGGRFAQRLRPLAVLPDCRLDDPHRVEHRADRRWDAAAPSRSRSPMSAVPCASPWRSATVASCSSVERFISCAL